MSALNVTLAARIVAETEIATVPEVAKRHGVSRQTVRNHLAREAKGLEDGAQPAFADFAARCRTERDALQAEKERRRHEWADLAVSSMRAALQAVETAANKSAEQFADGKIEKGRIRELAGFLKIVGELHLGKSVLFGGSSASRPHSALEKTQGGVRGTGTDEVH